MKKQILFLLFLLFVNFLYGQKAREVYSYVDDAGAVGDGITNDTEAIKTAINLWNIVTLTPGKTYLTTSTIAIGSGQCLNMPSNSKILFSGENDTCLSVKTDGQIDGGGKIISKEYDYTSVGIKISGLRTRINVGQVSGFKSGIFAGGRGCKIAGCRTEAFLYDNFYGLHINPYDSGFVNENVFDLTIQGVFEENSELRKNSIAIYMENNPTGRVPNSNEFHGWIENHGTGFFLIGSYNTLHQIRLEKCDTKIFVQSAKRSGTELTRSNYLKFPYGQPEDWTGKITTDGVNLYDALICIGCEDYLEGKIKLNIFPNPLTEDAKVKIDMPIGMEGKIIIYDLQGRIVLQKDVRKREFELKLGNLDKGIYFCIFLSKNKSSAKAIKLIKL